MGKMSADLDTLQQVRVVLADAMERGLDPAESLDKYGLLSYPAKDRELVRQTLHHAADVLRELTAGQLSGEEKAAITAMDMKRFVELWLRAQSAKYRPLP